MKASRLLSHPKFSLTRIVLLAMLMLSTGFAIADQKIKTKSNIKNDRVAQSSSSGACADQKESAADGAGDCKSSTANSVSNTNSSVAAKETDKSKP